MRLLLAGFFIFLAGCCQPQVETKSELSQTITNIDFNGCKQAYNVDGSVGGEHTDLYVIQANAGEKYQITVRPAENNLQFYISGDGASSMETKTDAKGTVSECEFTVKESASGNSIFEISVNAHPVDDYALSIQLQ